LPNGDIFQGRDTEGDGGEIEVTGMRKEIRISERDGFARRNFPCAVTVGFEPGEFTAGGPARMLDADGEPRPSQVDALDTWDDGSVRTAEVAFPARLPAGGEEVLTFEYGQGTPPPAPPANPIDVRAGKDPIEVQQGPVIYQVRQWRFNLVENVIFDGRAFHGAGAPGPALVLKDGRILFPSGEVRIDIRTRGPRSARLRVDGTYGGGYEFVAHMTFYSGVSWFRAEHEVVSGDVSQIATVVVESNFSLPDGPLHSAFGARQRADGEGTSWAVVTDNTSTVDVAAVGAWSGKAAVRYEVEPNGRFRTIFPFPGQPCILYVHYLTTPPMDHHHTPAAAMATDLECRVM
jgi:hypothetical protein